MVVVFARPCLLFRHLVQRQLRGFSDGFHETRHHLLEFFRRVDVSVSVFLAVEQLSTHDLHLEFTGRFHARRAGDVHLIPEVVFQHPLQCAVPFSIPSGTTVADVYWNGRHASPLRSTTFAVACFGSDLPKAFRLGLLFPHSHSVPFLPWGSFWTRSLP